MPYINEVERLAARKQDLITSVGMLNYKMSKYILDQEWLQASTPKRQIVNVIKSLCSKYTADHIKYNETEFNYTLGNGVIGAVECCRREFKRRLGKRLSPQNSILVLQALDRAADELYSDMLASYEDQKIEENGDI